MHGGNVGGNLGAEGFIHIVGIGGGHYFPGAGQGEVRVGGRRDRIPATATRVSVSEMRDGMEAGWGASLSSKGWRR